MYVILGTTGNTGRVAADSLLSQGKAVRVVGRDRAKLESWAARGADVAIADLSDAGALAKAFQGATGAYVLVPPNPKAPDFRAYQHGVIAALAEAVAAAKVPHVALLSSVGAQHAEGTGPIAALHRAEAALRGTGTHLSAIRAGYFAENFAGSFGMLGQGVLPSFLPEDLPIDLINTRDIGLLAAKTLAEGATTSSIIELGGPAKTTNDVAAVLSELLGKPIVAKNFGVGAVVPTLTGAGFSTDLANLYAEMIGAVASGEVAFEGGHRRVLATTPLADVLRPLLPKG